MSRQKEEIKKLTSENLQRAFDMDDMELRVLFGLKGSSECPKVRSLLEREALARGSRRIARYQDGSMGCRIPTPEEKRAELEPPNDEEVTALLRRVSFSISISRRMRITANIAGTSHNSVVTVMRELGKSGWDSEIVRDDRDGDYLNITERKTTEG